MQYVLLLLLPIGILIYPYPQTSWDFLHPFVMFLFYFLCVCFGAASIENTIKLYTTNPKAIKPNIVFTIRSYHISGKKSIPS